MPRTRCRISGSAARLWREARRSWGSSPPEGTSSPQAVALGSGKLSRRCSASLSASRARMASRSGGRTSRRISEHLRTDYRTNGKHLPTLDCQLRHLEDFFGGRGMVDIGLDDVSRYKDARLATTATNGTINRE